MDLSSIPGLVAALNALSGQYVEQQPYSAAPQFDLRRYQAHIRAHTQAIALTLDELPPLGDDARLDRIWRFIAIVFLVHAGLIEAWQDGPDVMVMRRETDREG